MKRQIIYLDTHKTMDPLFGREPMHAAPWRER
ncbi:hypothetical protein SAMN05421823_113134 [Catalinimonas alkaloidigena]|uniref:Uncharacterized protein n=1 Tax=Catalinimonas alkaloidigena TaxID=1075417 RepID=A0A1G9TB56_9BACT|nr:hypothetical protein SAMN05421823_113134 [Catalinimonas alkaloidigena]